MQRAQVTSAGRLLSCRVRGAAASRLPCALFLGSSTAARVTNTCCAVPVVHTTFRFASFSSSSASAAAHAGQRNHYRSLGVDTDATPQEVKAAYRQLALRYHPDVAAEEHKAQSECLFRRVSEAYEVLSDPVKRRHHDGELGIQTRRKQTASSGAAATATASSSASEPRGGAAARSPNAASSAFSATRRKRRSSSHAASASGRPSQQRQDARRYRKPFVRGDANRVFADAFDGKTLDEILFDVQRRRRQAATADASATSVKAADAPVSTTALGRDARLRHVMEEAAESFAQKARRQYGHGILRHIRASASALPEGPAPPPEQYMPFRPFVGMEVPAGVQTPPEPQLGHVLTAEEATVENTEDGAGGVRGNAGVPSQFHTHQYADGAFFSRFASMSKATKNIEGMPHNMGQLYSYQRPY